jgi:hypothetical protein
VGHVVYENSVLCSRSLLSAGRHDNPHYNFDWACPCIVNVGSITRLQSALRRIISEIGKETSPNIKITFWKIKAEILSSFLSSYVYIYIYIYLFWIVIVLSLSDQST